MNKSTRFVSLLLVILILSAPLAPLVALAEENATPILEASQATPVVAPVVVTPAPAVQTSTDSTTTELADEEGNVKEEEEDDTDDIDLGDDHAEMDALKDFTGVVRQSKSYTCGPASLATLLTQLGNDTSEEEVLEYITELSEEKGVTLLSLKVAAQKLNSQVVLKSWSAEQILSYINETQDPVLIHDEKKGVGGHFSVIREYNAEKGIVELSDTEAGNIKYSVEDFKHLYTGFALVSYEGEATGMLTDSSTDLSDEIAGTIWGKYVPVYMAANAADGSDKATQVAIAEYKSCVAKAMKEQDKNRRNNMRAICYTDMAFKLEKSLNLFQELRVQSKVDTSDLKDKQHEQAVGTVDILKALNDIAVAQKLYINTTVPSVPAVPASTLQTQYNTLNSKINQQQYDLGLVNSSITSKQKSYNDLQAEINGGKFVNGGQTFSLGAVGNQVTAQSATFSKLSANLKAKLSSIDGQITQIKKSLTSAQNNYNTFNKQVTDYQKQVSTAKSHVDYWQKQIDNINKQISSLHSKKDAAKITKAKNSLADAKNNLSAYKKQLTDAEKQYNTAKTKADDYQKQVNSFNSQITTLNNQKNSAQAEVDNASAEVARLQRLKTFGDQEMQRKKNVLTQLKTDMASLEKQIPSKQTQIATLQTQLAGIKSNLDKATAYQKALDTRANQIKVIDNIKKQYGFTTITYTNTGETERLKQEEISLVQTLDSRAEILATPDGQVVVGVTQVVADAGKFTAQVVTSVGSDAKACYKKGNVQECLSTCGISMDGATVATGATIVGAPVAAGTAVIGAMCDFSNGLIYLVNGEKIQAGAQMFAVIPILGMFGKGAGQAVKLTAKEATEVAAKVAAEKTAKEAAEKATVKIITGGAKNQYISKFSWDEIQLQSEFGKHVKDFNPGLTWSNTNRDVFKNIIISHINNVDTQIIVGAYRNIPAIHYFNPKNSLFVSTYPDGKFWLSWKLGADQITNLLRTGNIQ